MHDPHRLLTLSPVQLSGGLRPRQVRRLARTVRHHRECAGGGRAGRHRGRRAGGRPVALPERGRALLRKERTPFLPGGVHHVPLGTGVDQVRILDRKDFDGGIVADIEDAMRFIERNTRTAYRIEGLRREDVPEYPMRALREAITNAVMHRDWFFDDASATPCSSNVIDGTPPCHARKSGRPSTGPSLGSSSTFSHRMVPARPGWHRPGRRGVRGHRGEVH